MDLKKIKTAQKLNARLIALEKKQKANYDVYGVAISKAKERRLEEQVSALWAKVETLDLTEEEETEVFNP